MEHWSSYLKKLKGVRNDPDIDVHVVKESYE